MSLKAARVKEESDTMADAVVIKEEELEPDCVEVPYVAIEAAIVDVELDPPVPPEELYSKDLSEPAVYLDGQDELLKPECEDMSLCLEADVISQYAENIKDELVLEPECIQRVNTGCTRLCKEKFNPILTDCSVRIERCAAAEKALKEQMAELYGKETRMHSQMRDGQLFCEKCKRNEKYEFCEACKTNMRALNQLRKLRRERSETAYICKLRKKGFTCKQREKTFTCDICCRKFQERPHLYQHKFLIHGNVKFLQKINNPTEFYSGYLSRVYSEKTICGSTPNLLNINTTKISTEKSIPIKYKPETRKVQRSKIVVDSVNPKKIVPIDHKNEKQSYCCKMCNKAMIADKLCDDCEKEKALNQLSNLYVTKVRVRDDKFVDKKMISWIERPPRLPRGKRQMRRTKKQKLITRECFVRLERCAAAVEALPLKIVAVKSEIVAENTEIMLPEHNLTSDKSEEHYHSL
ncbi:uncharacterized protein LOC134752002 isoform X2 [Cydia strobilella]|uniref:uncharacterized protein LOC134752002 isoform X2 n=1 Tax=Cydia strobilella TaxID=1100964 RepID=UPI003005C40A